MPPSSVLAVSETLRQYPLLSEAQRQELVRDVQPRCADARSLARALLERGWLTAYQVNQVVQGKAADLVLGPYVLLERLGEGGTGQVFKARHVHMNRIVALKLIRPDLLTDSEIVGRFQREIQLVSNLTHPNVVRAYDAGPVGANYFLVMEFVEGLDLARVIKQSGPLPISQACDYIRQAALGLQHIHEKGLIHRDIKPSNLFLTGLPKPGEKRAVDPFAGESPHGTLKILDLGLARLQRPVNGEVTGDLTKANNAVIGTLDYMAPEQALDFHRADIRADIYSLGCSFHHLLTGQPPFAGGTLAQKLLRHQQAEAPPIQHNRPDLPPPIAAVLRKMMAKRPGDRYAAPGDVARLLNALGPPDTEITFLPAVVQGSAPLALPAPADPTVQVLGVRTGLPNQSKALTLLVGTAKFAWRHPRLALGGVAAAFLGLLLLVGIGALAFRSKGTPTVVKPSGPGPETTEPIAGETVFLSDLAEVNTTGAAFGKNGFLGHNGNGNLPGTGKENRIIVKGALSRKGISTLAPTTGAASVSYKLGKQFRRLQLGVGLHDGGWFSGSTVTFVVLGDGRVVWQSRPFGHDKPKDTQECDVDISGVDQIELQVTCTSSNNGVWPVWLDPRVSK